MWFKKKEVKEVIFNKEAIMQDLPKLAAKMYPKEVIQIHHEFNTAADRLLEEANKCLSDAASKDVDKVSRLTSLGFKQSNQVTELAPSIEKAKLSKEQLELLEYFKMNYPNNKFITEEQVKAICYKYNLVCGDVSRFKGFVPEKNLKEIESFKLKNNDCDIFLYYYATEYITESQAK